MERLENNAEPNEKEDPPLTSVPCLAPQLPMARVSSSVVLRAVGGAGSDSSGRLPGGSDLSGGAAPSRVSELSELVGLHRCNCFCNMKNV